MTGHTASGYPYAQGSDALTDWPAASLELATLLDAPRCKVTRTAFLSIGASVLTGIPWDSDTAVSCYDTDNMWSPGTPLEIKATHAGIYLFDCTIGWDAPASPGGFRQSYLFHNQTGRIFGHRIEPTLAGVTTQFGLAAVIPLNAGESITLRLAHNDSAAKALALSADSSFISAVRLCAGSRVSLGATDRVAENLPEHAYMFPLGDAIEEEG